MLTRATVQIAHGHLLHPKYRPDIDGLRAIAVMSVIAFHFFPNRMPGGFVGVDIFFVISGFLISTIIFGSLETRTFSYAKFYARRVKRIFPALILVLVACSILGWHLLLAEEYNHLGKHIAAAAGFASNFSLWGESGYFDTAADAKPLLHLWSLGIEEQYYVVWPLLLGVLWRTKFNFLAITGAVAIISFAVNVATVNTEPVAAFYSPLSRSWELMIGGLLAYILLHKPQLLSKTPDLLSFVGVALITFCLIVLTKDYAFPGWWALLPTFGSFLIIGAGPDAWLNRYLLSSRLFVGTGLISYPLYLWHWPLLSFARIVENETPPLITRVVLIAVAVVLASITYLLVERPIRLKGKKPNVTFVLGVALVITGLYGGFIYGTEGIKSRVINNNPAGFDFGLEDARVKRCFLGEDERPPLAAICDAAADTKRPIVVVWGDSHASSLALGLSEEGRVAGFELAIFTASGCPPLLDFSNEIRKWCRAENDFVAERVKRDKPRTVFLSAFWYLYNGYLKWTALDLEKLKRTVTFLKGQGVQQIVLVGQFPMWRVAQPRIGVYRFVSGKENRTYYQFNPIALQINDRMRSFAVENGISFLSPIDVLCDQEGCLLSTAKSTLVPVAWDYGHLTKQGATYLLDEAVKRNMIVLP